MKKCSGDTQTLHAGCSKVEQKISPRHSPLRHKESALAVVRKSQNFRPPQTPFPGPQDGQNSISWRRSLPSPTDPVWWKSMHTISSYRGNRRHTHTQTHPQTWPSTIHCAAKLSAQCNNIITSTRTTKRQNT